MPFLPVPEDQQPKEPCRHPEHYPPTMIVLENGTHRRQCPECGKITEFIVSTPTM